MERIRQYKDIWQRLRLRLALWRRRFTAAVKWWAEHQAWPATDEIRIDRNPRACC